MPIIVEYLQYVKKHFAHMYVHNITMYSTYELLDSLYTLER